MSRPAKLSAATLAVGTEVTDGQILDRNSAWISHQLVGNGIEVVEHRAVADDRTAIARALSELSSRVDLLFVTGGLGPTSDDFTREVLASEFGLELEFDQPSWDHIVARFQSRGLEPRPMQKQQCYFPQSALVLQNPAGTANAFTFESNKFGRYIKLFVLPGPPVEIAAVWELHLQSRLSALIPVEDREELVLFRTLGLGEGLIAEKTEAAISGSGLRVGYRAHLPYVEVKLWVPVRDRARHEGTIEAVKEAISPWLVGQGDGHDAADALISVVRQGARVEVIDDATCGALQDRVVQRALETKKLTPDGPGHLRFVSRIVGVGSWDQDLWLKASSDDVLWIEIAEDLSAQTWLLTVKKSNILVTKLEVKPTPLYNFGSERGRRYLVERVLLHLEAKIGV